MNVKKTNSSDKFLRVFISHSSADKTFVDWLTDTLGAYGVPIWYDKWEIKIGDSIVQKINDGLRRSNYLAVVLSKASVVSRWVQEELSAATIERIKTKGAYILPLLVESCDIPPLLSHLRYADFRTDGANALKELLDVLVPERNLVEEMDSLKKRIKILLREFDPHEPRVNEVIVSLDDLMQKLVHLRYSYEKRRNSDLPNLSDDFFSKLEYLGRLGLQTRSSAWSLVHSLRNRFFHASNRKSRLLKNRLKRISGCTMELSRIASRISRVET